MDRVKGKWLVMRMDDNGQVFAVRPHISRSSALLHMRMLEETPRNKQTYWVRQIDPADDDARSLLL